MVGAVGQGGAGAARSLTRRLTGPDARLAGVRMAGFNSLRGEPYACGGIE